MGTLLELKPSKTNVLEVVRELPFQLYRNQIIRQAAMSQHGDLAIYFSKREENKKTRTEDHRGLYWTKFDLKKFEVKYYGGAGDTILERRRLERKSNRITWFRGGILVGFLGKGIGNILKRDAVVENAEWITEEVVDRELSLYELIDNSNAIQSSFGMFTKKQEIKEEEKETPKSKCSEGDQDFEDSECTNEDYQ